MNNCKDVNKPSVDETQVECCTISRTNCIVSSEADLYMKYKKGETITNILKKFSDAIKAIRITLQSVSTRRILTGLLSQTTTNAPTISGVDSTLQSGLTYTLSRTSVGTYLITFSQGVLQVGTTYVTTVSPQLQTYIVNSRVLSATQIEITCLNASTLLLADNLMVNVPLQIKL